MYSAYVFIFAVGHSSNINHFTAIAGQHCVTLQGNKYIGITFFCTPKKAEMRLCVRVVGDRRI